MSWIGLCFTVWIASPLTTDPCLSTILYRHEVKLKDGRTVKLGKWVNNQRSDYKNGTLKSERMEKLKELGFVWKVLVKADAASSVVPHSKAVSTVVPPSNKRAKPPSNNLQWLSKYELLKAYKLEYGNCLVPHR